MNLYENSGLIYDIRTKFWDNFEFPYIIRKSFCLTRRMLDFQDFNGYKQCDTKLKELYNKHYGDRCFVVGMGPSLDKTNFDLIRKEYFIVSNNFYMGNFKVNPQYWCVADDGVFDIHHKQLLKQDTTMFLTEDASRLFLKHKEHYMNGAKKEPIVVRPLGSTDTWMKLSTNLLKGAYGGMVSLSCLQVAFHLGFKEVYLLGCDCDISKGIHFKKASIFGKADNIWEPAFRRYEMAKRIFEKDGRKIYNATVGGKLEVFERKSLEGL